MIAITDLTKTYGDTTALGGVSLEYGAGLHCLAGPNGSGKTTLLRAIAGLTRPTAGRVETPDSLGYAFQRPNVYPDLTVRENLDVFQSLTDADDEWRDSLVERLRLAPERDRAANALSGGFRKKLDLALALLKRPEVLLLDEPLADLDPATRRRLVAVATEYADGERCVLVSTHNLEAFSEQYDSLTVLVDGYVSVHQHQSDADAGPSTAYERLLDGAGPSRK
ncbi:ATP-binding cassette domain-containing protein [Halobacterium zhouii]|uniref:ATP-binding cassette domain-containing protein n=1 Tax=Halobacterium zhouii TaxID=2902624 RepID=UPI001E5A4964|nr:ABC transporter ATP-binding protein [Halobacterium zhouii]